MDAVMRRRDEEVDFINARGEVTFGDLKERFVDVSDMTLRTDLKHLDDARRIIRIHGGAKSVGRVIGNDDLIAMRQVRNVAEKKKIAEKALSLIGSNRCIFVDSGSTTTELCKIFPDGPNIIYTSSLSAAAELSSLKEAHVYLPGGRLNSNSLSISGPAGIRELSHVNFDAAFIGVTGYTDKAGFNSGSESDTMLKRISIERSQNVIVLMDASKLGKSSTYSICGLSEIDIIVGDGGLPEDFLAKCADHNVTVL